MEKAKVNLMTVEVDGVSYKQIMQIRGKESGLPLFLVENPNSPHRYKLSLEDGTPADGTGFDNVQPIDGRALEMNIDIMAKDMDYIRELVKQGVRRVAIDGGDVRNMNGFVITPMKGRVRITYCRYVPVENN